MYRYIVYLFVFVSTSGLFANCSQVPEAIRQSYASDFYQAFISQSNGKSTVAFCQFQGAYEVAKKAGENIQRLMVLEQLFGWYRMYGSALRLFSKNPTGHDRIVGEYKKPSLTLSSAP